VAVSSRVVSFKRKVLTHEFSPPFRKGTERQGTALIVSVIHCINLHPRRRAAVRLAAAFFLPRPTYPILVKRFRQPAGNQELLLIAAEELGWQAWFDDPLPRAPGQNPKVRLHNSINALNRNQKSRMIHFKGDGSARRVGWEYR
jgi:hypothetical protein